MGLRRRLAALIVCVAWILGSGRVAAAPATSADATAERGDVAVLTAHRDASELPALDEIDTARLEPRARVFAAQSVVRTHDAGETPPMSSRRDRSATARGPPTSLR